MTPARFITFGCLLASGIASAGVPVRRPLEAYRSLWDPGVICSPRVDKPEPPHVDPLADWQLTGLSELQSGYLVTLANRKNAGEKLVVRPSGTEILGVSAKAGPDFKVTRVEFAKEWRDSVVHLDCGGTAAVIRFDEKLPVPAAATAAAPVPPQAADREGRPRLTHPPAPANPKQPHAPSR